MNKRIGFNRRSALKTAALAALAIPSLRPGEVAAAPDLAPGKSAQNSGLKLGVTSFSLAKLSPDQVIDALKRLQINYVSLYKNHAPWGETAEECRAAAKKFQDVGIAVTGSGVIELPNDETLVRKAFDNARAAGLPTMVCKPAPDAFPLVEKFAREYDLKLAIHNHGPTDLYPSGEHIWKVIQPYDKRIGLCLDVGHAWRAGADPAAEILRCHERLYKVHLKDTKGPTGGGVTKDPAPVVIGHGQIDIRAILAALVRVQFPFEVEFEYEQQADDKMPGLAESVGYVRGMLTGMAT